ncbi:MAG: FG-GAP-like repeat-containing protein [Bacteroidetes bacterium]|nr:FG-GAP-like repeat-containing protein [Bacteroidota bacterium]
MLFINGIIEYCTLSLNSQKSLNVDDIEMHHYSLYSYNMPYRIAAGTSLQKNIQIFYSRKSVLYSNLNNSPPKMFPLFDLNKNFDVYGGILKVNIADTNFGWFLFNSNNFLYERKNQHQLKIFSLDTLKLNGQKYESGNNIISALPFSKDNIWAVTKDGKILHQLPSSDKWDKRTWSVVAEIKNFQPVDATAVDSTCIYLFGNSLIKMQIYVRASVTNNNQKSISKQDYLFDPIRLISTRAAYGAGIADLDNDGNEDVYIVNIYGMNEIYFNKHPIDFVLPNNEFASQRNLTGRTNYTKNGTNDLSAELGLAVDDFCEDGNQDIYITRLAGSNPLFLNNGSGYFKDVTDEMNLNHDIGRSECAVAADVDNSGYLDIFTSSFFLSNRLFINNKAANFIDGTKKSHLASNGSTVCAAFGDINNDGYDDLYIGNWGRENKLYLNNGDGTFGDITRSSGTGCGDLKETNSVLFADFNNDGLLDLFVGNRGNGNKLFLNRGNGKFEDVTDSVGLKDTVFTYGAAFGDFDNDGYLDLFVSYLGGFKIYRNMMGSNNGKLFFKDVTDSYLGKGELFNSYNTGAATADFDKDGDLDIFASQNGGSSILFDNLLHQHSRKYDNYLEVKVEGSQSNRDGVGAKLKLFRNDTLIAYREVESGYGYASSSSKIQHFGLGNGAGKFKLQVNFPMSGVVKTLAVQPKSFITVKEHQGITESYFIAKKALIRYILGKDFVISFLKFILFLILIMLIAKAKLLRSNFESADKNKLKQILSLSFPAIIIFVVLYLVIEFIFYYSQNFYMSSYYYMSNTRNLFVEDALPFIVVLGFEAVYLKVKKDKELRNIGSENLIANIWTLLRRFGHGEGMLMNINRLSLFMKNIAFDASFGIIPKAEINERISEIIEEYKRITIPGLKKISSLLIQIQDVKHLIYNKNELPKNFDFESVSKTIPETSEQLLYISQELLNMINDRSNDIDYRVIMKLTDEFENKIKILKQEITAIRDEIKKYFITDLDKAIELTLKKFKPKTFDSITIDYSNKLRNQKIFITLSELSEILSIIIQNAIDEIGRREDEKGIIRISTTESESSIIINVEDNGKGIPMNRLDTILDWGQTSKLGNHGFGLRYVRSCLEKYEGKIALGLSELGGACFLIELNKF